MFQSSTEQAIFKWLKTGFFSNKFKNHDFVLQNSFKIKLRNENISANKKTQQCILILGQNTIFKAFDNGRSITKLKKTLPTVLFGCVQNNLQKK